MFELYNMMLSKNLSLDEVIKSNTATRLGISNYPTDEHLENLKEIAEKVFQPMRDFFGVPIFISSGYRSEELNKAIGGSKTSQHCNGEALDIDMDGSGSHVLNYHVYWYIRENLDFDQLIWEFGDTLNPAWVHVSYKKDGNRKEILRAYKDNGKTKYQRV